MLENEVSMFELIHISKDHVQMTVLGVDLNIVEMGSGYVSIGVWPGGALKGPIEDRGGCVARFELALEDDKA
jgi:hypothetical protein